MKTLKEIINNKEAKFRNPRDYEDLGVGGVKYRQRKGAKKKEKKDDVLGYREGSEIEEGAKFSAAQLDKLKAQYSTIQKIDPTGSSYKKMKDMMNRMSKEQLKQIKAAKIKFLQYTAGDLLRKMGEEVEINEEVFYWYIIKGTSQKGKVWKTGTERQMKLLLRKPTMPTGYVLTKSRKDLSSGDVWKGSMGVSEEVEKRKGPPRITNMWKRDEVEIEEGSAKNLDALRTALAMSKFKKAGGKVEKQPPGIAKGALKFRGKGGTTRDDDEEDRINRDVMSWRKLRAARKERK